jgi:hypothetical protein
VDDDLERRLARFVDHHVRHGDCLPLEPLVEGRPDLAAPLRALVDRYLDLAITLDAGLTRPPATPEEPALPTFAGFRTIERLGSGGMGEVYELQDLKLDRTVAAKVIRPDRAGAPLADFLGEARAQALFSDRRIVQVFEFRADADPPVLIMEFVDGFELGRLGPSLEYRQRARILLDVCEAMERAHALGIQHRDLEPSNIMLDAGLSPKILDFGLSGGDPSRGHLVGTPRYLAPEQLDPDLPIDARTDVYALGAILYELLTGTAPYGGGSVTEVLDAVKRGELRLPIEIDARVPEALQAIALKAMERRPEDRYQSAREMALDLGRYLENRPVLGRPTIYASTLATRVRPHMDQVAEWLRLKLIYPHEAVRLQAAYRQLEAREDDWIVESRSLSYSQIALYLGAFLLVSGSLFYFAAHRFHEAVMGVVRPFFVLGVPFVGLNLAGRYLYRRDHQAVAVAFYLAGVSLLPLFLLIWFHESGLWVVPPDTEGQLFTDGSVSNRQLQITILAACAWSGWLALRTRTSALGTVLTVLLFLLALAVLGDFGLRGWLEEGRFDRLALHLWPLALVYAGLGALTERTGRLWFTRPMYVAGSLVLVAALDLLALDGRALGYVGLSMQSLQPEAVSDPTLLDTMTALAVNGVAFYATASLLDRYASELTAGAAWLLFTISPFSMLEPVAYVSQTKQYSLKVDWLYLALAVAIAIASHARQRRSFYYAGLLNTGVGLYLIADHRQWFDRPMWAMAVILCGLVTLLAGFVLDRARRRRVP